MSRVTTKYHCLEADNLIKVFCLQDIINQGLVCLQNSRKLETCESMVACGRTINTCNSLVVECPCFNIQVESMISRCYWHCTITCYIVQCKYNLSIFSVILHQLMDQLICWSISWCKIGGWCQKGILRKVRLLCCQLDCKVMLSVPIILQFEQYNHNLVESTSQASCSLINQLPCFFVHYLSLLTRQT